MNLTEHCLYSEPSTLLVELNPIILPPFSPVKGISFPECRQSGVGGEK